MTTTGWYDAAQTVNVLWILCWQEAMCSFTQKVSHTPLHQKASPLTPCFCCYNPSFSSQTAVCSRKNMIISPDQGPGWHSPRCEPIPWRGVGSATTSLSRRWRCSLGGHCLDHWHCRSCSTDPKLRHFGGGRGRGYTVEATFTLAVKQAVEIEIFQSKHSFRKLLHGTFYMEQVDQLHTQHWKSSCRNTDVCFSKTNLKLSGDFQVERTFKADLPWKISRYSTEKTLFN